MEFKLALLVPFFLFVITNGDLLGSIRNLWYKPVSTPPQGSASSTKSTGGEGKHTVEKGGGEVSGRTFSARGGYYEGDPYETSASQRGWGGGGWGWGDDHQNLDLYSLLGGLSFASLLGATIIYLARRNTSGRRRRSADGLSYLDEDEMDFSEDPQTRGLNIVDLIDSFLDNAQVFSGEAARRSVSQDTGRVSNANTSYKVHLGPGVVPHQLIDSSRSK